MRQPVTVGVGDLNPEGAAHDVEQQLEVPARDAAVGGRVVRQFGHDVRRRVQRELPAAQLLGGEETSEARSARGGGQQDAEVADGAVGLGGLCCCLGEFLIHITQRGRVCLP